MGNKTKIEWCDSTWNPVTGCYHGCEYCYARSIAERFGGADPSDLWRADAVNMIHTLSQPLMRTDKEGRISEAPYPFSFEPTLHRKKLDELAKITGETVFVGSMTDLFGSWVPKSWLDEVFGTCMKTPGHRYLFLTKNPARYVELGRNDELPIGDEFWYGTTTTGPDEPAFYSRNHHTFVSVEPLLQPFDVTIGTTSTLDTAEWFIFGAETGRRKDRVIPERWWIEEAVEMIRQKNKPIFMKDSMKAVWGTKLITEFPW